MRFGSVVEFRSIDSVSDLVCIAVYVSRNLCAHRSGRLATLNVSLRSSVDCLLSLSDRDGVAYQCCEMNAARLRFMLLLLMTVGCNAFFSLISECDAIPAALPPVNLAEGLEFLPLSASFLRSAIDSLLAWLWFCFLKSLWEAITESVCRGFWVANIEKFPIYDCAGCCITGCEIV